MTKRLTVIFIAMLLVLCTVSCAETNNGDLQENKYQFIYKDAKFGPGDDFSSVEPKLGTPSSYYEAASCAFDGKDKIYTYGSVQIGVSELEGRDIIFSITLLDDSLSTPEGIFVGSEKKTVTEKYGGSRDNNDNSLSYYSGHTKLMFIIRDGYVTSIQYRYGEDVKIS